MKVNPFQAIKIWARTTAVLAAVGLLAGCISPPQPRPDFNALYSPAARHHDADRNPVIVIPGILGSKLVDTATEEVVWGAFGGGSTRPRSVEGARLAALPMRRGAPLVELVDGVVPDGVLAKIRVTLAGLPIQLQAYYEILRTLGVGGYRDETFQADQVDYGEGHFTCFQFDYDFRRDNVENARRLQRFIDQKRAYILEQSKQRFGRADENLKFDVIAHSMGGLLLRYYLRYGGAELPADGSEPELTWAGADHVERAVLIATPNAGAVDVAKQLIEGRKFGPIGPSYEAAILGSFPSMWQMLPRARHRAVVDPDGRAVDLLDPQVWERHGWGLADPDQDPMLENLLPGELGREERRAVALDHLAKSLERARRFHAALDRPASPPSGTEIYLVAGDAMLTPQVATIDAAGQLTVTAEAPGDGRVLRSSALMDERVGGEWTPQLRSPIDWEHVTFLFSNHHGMTKDPAFADNVLYLLLEAPRDRSPS